MEPPSDRRVSFDPDTDEYFELSKGNGVSGGTPKAVVRTPPRIVEDILDEDNEDEEEGVSGDPLAAAEALENLYDVNIGEIARLKEMLGGPSSGQQQQEEEAEEEEQQQQLSNGSESTTIDAADYGMPSPENASAPTGGAALPEAQATMLKTGGVTGAEASRIRAGGISTTDRLIQKKQEYEQRREQMRRAQEEAEEAEMQVKPQVNKHSERLLSGQARKSIAERSQEQVVLKKERAERLKAELAAKETDEIRHPQINDRSKKLMRDVGHMQQWEQEKLARREVRQHMQAMEQDIECSFAPTLNKRTEKLTASRSKPRSKSVGPGGRRHIAAPLKIEERLLQQAEVYREKREVAKERKDHEARQEAVPQLAPHSSNLPRSGDVASRLYGIAEAKRVKKEKIERRARVLVEHNIDPETGNELFKPKINASSKAMVRRRRGPNERVEDSLTAHGKSYLKRQQDRQVHEDRSAREKTEVRISRQSEKIVGVLEQRTQESAMDRLAKPIGQRVKKTTIEAVPQYDFKPKKYTANAESVLSANHGTPEKHMYSLGGDVLPSEEVIEFTAPRMPDRDALDDGGDYGDGSDLKTLRPSARAKAANPRGPTIAERGAIWEQKRAAKERALALEREKALAAECSFIPKVSAQSSRVASRAKAGKGSMWERNAEWSKRRADKLEAERRVREEEELAECTFVPNADNGYVAGPYYDAAADAGADYSDDADDAAACDDPLPAAEDVQIGRNTTIDYEYADDNDGQRNGVPSEADIREIMQRGSSRANAGLAEVNEASPDREGRTSRYMMTDASSAAMNRIDTSGEVVVEMPLPPPAPESPLPPGWQRVVSDEGAVYYYDIVSGATQWEPPRDVHQPRISPPQPPPPWAEMPNKNRQQRVEVRLDDFVASSPSAKKAISVTNYHGGRGATGGPSVFLQSQTWLEQARAAENAQRGHPHGGGY